ncbi:MAG: helix-turn-helix transcriptional regulator [Paraburkholderia tropica]|nr:helix-turn-helix transcriptional regulator [Paraburkholderia tropica]
MNAQTIIAELLRRGLTQKEIERRCGVDQSTVSAIHTGRRGKRVSYEVVVKLQKLLDDVMAESPPASDDTQPPTGGSSGKEKLAKVLV